MLAVSHPDQSPIVASIVSRRGGQAISPLICGTGMHRIRTVPAQGRDARSRRAGFTWGLCGLVGVPPGFGAERAVGQSPIL
jgi:hypothetical protein